MTETALTDAQAEALHGTTPTDTDFAHANPHETFTHTGTRREKRLLQMASLADEGRVFKDGTLTYGVRAIEWDNYGSIVTKAQDDTNALTDDATNYVYYTPAGTLTVSTTSFPTARHIPLATIATGSASGAAVSGTFAYTDITDKRVLGLFSGADTLNVEENTAGSGAPNVLTANESGLVVSNEGSTATNYNTLPTCAAGLHFTFVRADATDNIRITAAASDIISIGATLTKAAGYIESTARWDAVTLIAVDEVYWVAVAHYGTWTVETS